jgi:hypothetical protein
MSEESEKPKLNPELLKTTPIYSNPIRPDDWIHCSGKTEGLFHLNSEDIDRQLRRMFDKVVDE